MGPKSKVKGPYKQEKRRHRNTEEAAETDVVQLQIKDYQESSRSTKHSLRASKKRQPFCSLDTRLPAS